MPIVTQFLIVGTYRTGSSALVHSLNLHPRIACGLEWTQKLSPWGALSMADRALSGDLACLGQKHQDQMAVIYTAEKSVLGFKRLFRASNKWLVKPAFGPLIIDGLAPHLRWIARRPELRIIHIVRNDHLAWIRSKAFADATGKYSGTAYPEHMEVSVSPREAVRRVRAKLYIDEKLSSLAGSNPYLRIDYESFAADNYRKTCDMAAFLGCDPAELPRIDLTERIQSRPSHRISNLEPVRRALEMLY